MIADQYKSGTIMIYGWVVSCETASGPCVEAITGKNACPGAPDSPGSGSTSQKEFYMGNFDCAQGDFCCILFF